MKDEATHDELLFFPHWSLITFRLKPIDPGAFAKQVTRATLLFPPAEEKFNLETTTAAHTITSRVG